MTDVSRAHGVDYTVIRNLTGESIFLHWFPTSTGHGRSLEAYETVRFSGNLFEAIVGVPALKDQMDADTRAGKVAISACGDPTTDYDVLDVQAYPGFRTWGCAEYEYDSSSSAWSVEL